MSSWDEVKRLAADFQKVQLSASAQKLSERNCIEIITYLIEKKLINLIFTSDGKEYLTPEQLISDIHGELYVSGGRINLVELSKNIGVDLGHINAHINDILKGQKDILLILGQLVNSQYIARIAGEINERLVQNGQINVSELTVLYDLPAEFIQVHVFERNLGKVIHAQQDKTDPRIYFTESFIARTRAKLRGALIGLTRPVPVTAILSQIDLTEKLFFLLFDQCNMHGSLTSRTSGAQYIPNIYAKSQIDFVTSFYKQNSYIEFDALARLGITDHKMFLKRIKLPDLHVLRTCAVSKSLFERIQADIDECIASKSYLDLKTNLPSVLSDEDIDLVLEKVLSEHKVKDVILLEGYVISKAFIDSLIKDCESSMMEKAKMIVDSGEFQQFQMDLKVPNRVKSEFKSELPSSEDVKADKREDRRKKATSGKSGGGNQGRETRTKSTKKLYGRKHQQEEEEATCVEVSKTLEVMTLSDIISCIHIILDAENLEDILDAIASHLHPIINEKALEQASLIYQTTVADRTTSRRQTHNDVQNKLNVIACDIRLYEKGLKLFPADVQGHLYKYLLRSLCTDFLNELLNYISSEEGHNTNVTQMNNDQKQKFINEQKNEYKMALTILLKSLSSGNVDDFMDAIDPALATCSMILKKIDKKKDRVLVLNQRHALLDELEKSDDPPVVLLLATLVVFITCTQCMVHASGRHVVHLLAFLKSQMSGQQHEAFVAYHDMVSSVLGGGSDVEAVKEKLVEKMPLIKQIAIEFKKVSGAGGEKSSAS